MTEWLMRQSPLIPNPLPSRHKRKPDQVEHPINCSQRCIALRGRAIASSEAPLHLKEHVVDLIVGEWAFGHRGEKMHFDRVSVNNQGAFVAG